MLRRHWLAWLRFTALPTHAADAPALLLANVYRHGGMFDERLRSLNALVMQINQPWVQAVPQKRIDNDAALQALLQRTVRAGGEGLMLHRGSSLYQSGRSDDLVKVKTHEDTEARVVAHLPGKGRHAGRMGALLVEMPSGQRFRLGAGVSDSQRG